MKNIITVVFFFFLLPLIVKAEDSCTEKTLEVNLEQITATADSLPNLRNIAGSLRFESNRLLSEAENKISKGNLLPQDKCPAGCRPEEKPQIIFSCIPKKYLNDSDDFEYCTSLEQKTKVTPFEYSNREFLSISQLAEWFSDFSQGKGKDGNDLYKRCDKSCSPQYHNQVYKVNDKFNLSASVVCGPARDKSDNKYTLSTVLRWQCIK